MDLEKTVSSNVKSSIKRSDFIRTIINEHIKTNKYKGKVVTRFPPEPNGFLHIGHAKSICLNFGIAKDYDGGICHLRFDDTDPTKEDFLYVNSIQEDVKWLGFDWGDKMFFASDYFENLYEYAIKLIQMGKAYVCSLNEEEIKEYRGTVKEAGRLSPSRNRSIEENLKIFEEMKAGKYKDGELVLRAKIDMASPNMKMRDPLLYRIRHANHYRIGDKWCIYPMYDFAHCLSDYIEGITHSICTLEFENNRELYDWILDELELEPPRPYQYEFARLNLNYTVMSKRKLLELVETKQVQGWDDPRLPTISGLRRSGYTSESIRSFCDVIGISKSNSSVDIAQLEFAIRDDLNQKVPRVLSVLKPLKVVIENYPEDKEEILDAPLYPYDVPLEGSRSLPFSREIFIEQDDFMENPSKKYFRLAPGKEVRLRHAYIIKCERVIKDEKTGEVKELRCSYYPDSKSGSDTSEIKVKGTIHWVSAKKAKKIEVRLYDRLFVDEFPETESPLNPDSLEILDNALVEPYVLDAKPGSRFQFERQGYFYYDPYAAKEGKIVFNRIVTLKDSWAKMTKKAEKENKKQEIKPDKKQLIENIKNNKPDIKDLTPEIKERFNKYKSEYSLSEDDAYIIAKDVEVSAYYEKALSSYNKPVEVSKWIINDLLRELKDKSLDQIPVKPEQIAELVSLIDKEIISGKIAKDVFVMMLEKGESPKAIVEEKGLKQITNSAELEPIVEKIIKAHPENLARYKEGHQNLFGFFIGQVMKATAGKANPKLVNDLVKKKLEEN